METITIKGDMARMNSCVDYLIKKLASSIAGKVICLTVENAERPTQIVQVRDKPTRECAAIKFTLTTEGILLESDWAFWYDMPKTPIGGMLSRWHYEKLSKSIFLDAMSYFTSR